MTSAWPGAIMLGFWLALASILPACARNPCACSESQEQGRPIDPNLLAFLSRAKSAHHLADLHEEADPRAALAVLVEIAAGPIPGNPVQPPDEVREVIADTQARIAELQSRMREYGAALDRIETALKLVPETNYFRGHLFETRGIVEQRHAEELARGGDDRAAQAAKSRALVAFETAMQIQADVIRHTPMAASPMTSVRALGPSTAAVVVPLPATSNSGAN